MSDLSRDRALDRMLAVPGVEWWLFIPCATCNSPRNHACQAMDGPARGPHASRRRTARVLWSTVQILDRWPEDLFMQEPEPEESA